MNKVLVIWLWEQWKKYINYFIKNDYDVFWVCKSVNTKKQIETKYGINVFLNYKKLNLNTYSIIIVCIPPEVQWKVSLDILQNWFSNKLLIEIPVTWDKIELEKIKKYENVIFYLEEYYTLLSQFLRKLDTNNIQKIDIEVSTNREDYENLQAREVTYIHIKNNFLWLNINNINYNFSFHKSSDIFYEITFEYKWERVNYVFNKDKYLNIWNNKFVDDYNFDNVLTKMIIEKSDFNKYYFI